VIKIVSPHSSNGYGLNLQNQFKVIEDKYIEGMGIELSDVVKKFLDSLRGMMAKPAPEVHLQSTPTEDTDVFHLTLDQAEHLQKEETTEV
jgi:hypothetical protein